ncbi:Protein Jumonji [Araneus ventricosus]|uniref:Protein Jumonji n=1 Tax=Araneus ventricosus TaxID=182803 RepID=A0A4Y2I5A3_ARAVE|nr:Protein Jumonji [Araneus ventricosus]
MKPFVKKEKSSGQSSEESSSQRPKRSTCQKNLDGSNGLLWREETDLKKALYASLQETKRKNLDEDEDEPEEDMKAPTEEPAVNEQDDILKKAKVHAQRKFAQGSNPNSPVPTPLKVPYVNNSTTELLPYKRPKTEDFLTFLCLRGTSILPPSLDFLNCCSKSDTSSDCRSLSPDLEIKENGNHKELTQKTPEPRDKNAIRHENLPNGAARKSSACKALTKKQLDSAQSLKKAHSKSHKEVSIVRKRKSRDGSTDVEFIPSASSRSKTSSNTRTRSSALNALREKYKKKRLETNKKKLIPPKPAAAVQPTKSAGSTTRSQSNVKPTEKRTSRNTVNKNEAKSTPLVPTKIKQSRTERKLAIEKRKSLRSAHPTKTFGQKRLALNKKTMWLRRAKLVPPIVDVDSDSEPEVINSAPAKKNQSQALPSAKQDKTENSSRISERLRNREDSKDKSSLTPRQILLRKHMQNRLNAKKSALHSKNIKSRTIIKRTAKQRILKKVARKSLVSKTMSLRKDLQNKRVTRSAKHQIEEMLWANPEKKSKLQSSKSIPLPKQDKKRHINDDQTAAKKQKLTLHKKETGSKLTKSDKETKNKSLSSEPNKASKQVSSSKVVKKMADSVMHTRSSKTPAHIEPKPSCSSNTGNENLHSRSRSGDVKAVKSSESRAKSVDSKNKINQNKGTKHIENKTNKSADIKMNKLDDKTNKVADASVKKLTDNKVNKSSENSLSKPVDNRLSKSDKLDKASAVVNKKEHQKPDENKLASKTNNSNIKSEDLANVTKINRLPEASKPSNAALKPEIENNLKSLSNKGKESISKNNFENNLEKHSSNLIKDEESSVQNNLNLQKNDKNLKKDISELISLNVECEEPAFIINCEPSCSGIDKEESDKKLNLDKSAKFNSKLDASSSESHNIKKHNDKKYFKNTAYKEDKLLKKMSDKNQKVQNKISEKSGKSHKKESVKEFENNRSKSEIKDSTKNLQKKELNKQGHENVACVSTSSINGASNQINIATMEDESIFKHVAANKTMNKDTKESFNKDKLDNRKHSEKAEVGKRPSKVDLKKDFKKIKTDNTKISSDISSSYNNLKKNPDAVSYKSSNEVKLDNKNCQVVDSISFLDKDSDDDSDYDITLDQYLKLKSNFMSSKAASSSSSSSLEEKVNSESNLLFIEVKDSKVKKDSEKVKKEGESSKHKKDKSSSKDKSSKKDDKSSKKDSEKSLAKLLKRERSKSSKKEEKERMKHKRESSCSSKSSKRDSEKDGSKLNRKEGERENSSSEKKSDAKIESSEGKKEKSSKKDSSKLSRSNSYEETKSPKKKKKHNELKDIEKIKNLISKSSILNEISGFKEFKRRLSSDKKSKKRKKLALLKEKKLSKKLSSKLLRKYSKKKGLKKKNKLKKKELKKEKLNLSEKSHSKNKKQKHKTKGDHHKKDNQEKHKNLEALSLTSVDKESSSSVSESLHSLSKSSVETHHEELVNITVQSTTNDTQTCTNDISTPTTYVIEAISDNATPIETLTATDVSQRISTDLVFSTNDNYQGIVTGEFPGVFEETFPPGAILLTTRDSISQVPLHFIQDIPPPVPKTMADAATNTCEDDLEETLSSIPEHVKSEEMSVGTQTMTPVGSPSPTTEMKSIVPTTMADSLSTLNHNSQQPKKIPDMQTVTNVDSSVIPTTSQRPVVSNFVHLPSPKPVLSESVSHVLLPVTGGKIQMPTDVHTTVSPVKPNMANSITVPLVSVTPGKPKIPANAVVPLTPVTPGKSKISANVSVPLAPLTPGKAKICTNVTVSLSPVTSGKPKMSSNITVPLTPLTPEKSKISSNVNVPLSVTTSGASKFSGNTNISILPSPPKVTNCVKIPIVSVTPEKSIAPKSTSSPNLPAITPGVSKVSDSTRHPPTPGKSPVSTNSVIGPSKTPNKSKASTSSIKQSATPKEKKRSTPSKKAKTATNISFTKSQQFPLDSARLVAAPVFYPEENEFTDPLEYINKIRPEAEQYGICKIVPPSSFKPECKVNDDMRFTAHNQYLHKMLYRWGPNVQDTACIRKHLKSQKMKFEQAPLMGGIELDICKFYHTVQQYGGLQQVIEKKRWQKVADAMRVPKSAQDRVTKLYDAYCKYLVSYDLLPSDEKQKIKEEVLADHEKHVKLRNSPDSADEEVEDEENYDCVTKGRSMSLSNFYRIARNTMNMWFKNEPAPEEVEHEFWKIVTERQQRVVVHAGNIDSCVTQSGFPTNRSPFAKHPWNLKVLTNNSRSVLRSMGPLSGITVPTLHVGMLFTTGCWYRDPHSFPWIEYLHTGASKIWYGIPANGCEKFRNAMKKIVPEYCTNKPLWLSSDTAMVPPELLVKHGASLSRTIQSSGQFVVIFPESFTSTICSGYCVSESVYFAPTQWLDLAVKAFQDIKNSYESPAFSLERLLFSIGNDPKPPLKTHLKTLEKILPMIENIRRQELQLRAQLNELGLKQFERLPLAEVRDKKKRSRDIEETEQECEICHTLCYVSMVVNPQEETVYCLPHAIEQIPKKNFKSCRLKYTYNESDMNELLKKIRDLVSQLPNHNAKKKTPKKKVHPITEK